MNVHIAENALKSTGTDKWSIKGEHLCYVDGDTRFLFDKISDGFLGFRKLVLVSDGRLVEMSFFDKKRLYPLVVAKGLRVENDMRMKALQNVRTQRRAPSPPPPPKPRTKVDTKAVAQKWAEAGFLGGLSEMSAERLSDILGGDRARPQIPDEGKLSKKVKDTKKMVEKTLTDAEQKSKVFKDNVEKEKARIRKLLRKGSADGGPR